MVIIKAHIRGIELSLGAFARMRPVCLFLRARAVFNFLMRAASTLEITNREQRVPRKFSTSWNISLLKRCFAPNNLADTLKQDDRRKARQNDKALSRFNHSQ